MKNLKYIIGLMAAVTLTVSFTGCDGDEASSKNDAEVVYYDNSNSYVAPEDIIEEAKKNAKKTDGKMNEKSTISGFDITAKDVVSLGTSEDATGETFDMYAVQIEVTNNNEEPLKVSGNGDFQISVDGGADIIGIDPTISVIAAKTIEEFTLLDYEVQPGETKSGYITFGAPLGWKEVNISYIPFFENNNYDAVVYKLTPDMVK